MLASLEVPAVKDLAELRTTNPGVTGSLQEVIGFSNCSLEDFFLAQHASQIPSQP